MIKGIVVINPVKSTVIKTTADISQTFLLSEKSNAPKRNRAENTIPKNQNISKNKLIVMRLMYPKKKSITRNE